MTFVFAWLWGVGTISGCGRSSPEAEPVAPPPAPLAVTSATEGPWGLAIGRWAASLRTDAGPVRFMLDLDARCRATLLVGDQTVPVGVSECEAGTLSMRFSPYASTLGATIGPDGRTLKGHWNHKGDGLAFDAVFVGPPDGSVATDAGVAWLPVPADAPSEVALDVEGRGPVLLTLRGAGPELSGSVAAATGDWGPLAGGWQPEGLELHGFDGSQAVLLRLAPDETGKLSGHVAFRGGAPIPVVERDAPVDLDGWDDLRIERIDLNGVALPRLGADVEPLPTQGPRIVHFTASWCPNCNDAAPVLERIHREVPGVQVLGLAWELGAPASKADRQLGWFRDRHGITHPMYRLDALPTFVPPVPAWPTTVFVRGDGTVAAVHVGFLGPSVGARHQELVERLMSEARALTGP